MLQLCHQTVLRPKKTTQAKAKAQLGYSSHSDLIAVEHINLSQTLDAMDEETGTALRK